MKINLLKEVLKHQVYPALGCTEPVSVALAAATAAEVLKKENVNKALLFLDGATFKNGLGVKVPNTGGLRGNLVAAALGLVLKNPKQKMELLKSVKPEILNKALQLIKEKRVVLNTVSKKGFYICVNVEGERGSKVKCIISGGHQEISYLSLNGKILKEKKQKIQKNSYLQTLRKANIADLIRAAEHADKADLDYIKQGVKMNLAASKKGEGLEKVGFYLKNLVKQKILSKNLVIDTKILCAQAADGRMDGFCYPVMSSGGSGNQGIVAILVPYYVGKQLKIKEEKILKSIALSHLLNGYVKVFTGELAPICGCAIAAGVGAAAALVYQQKGADIKAITLAINNIISDIGGMLCDGAKSGCALKVVSSVDSALRAAFMGIKHYGITEAEGFVGSSAEKTIQNLSKISNVGMLKVDSTIVGIMKEKIK